jgi:hypothetical protein
MKPARLAAMCLLLCLATVPAGPTGSGGSFELDFQIACPAGSESSSLNYAMSDRGGDSLIPGRQSSANYSISISFDYEDPEPTGVEEQAWSLY